MFAEGDLFGTIPATFEILCSGFQSDAHLSPRLGEDPTKAFFLPWNDLSGVESASYDPWKQRCLLYSWYFSSCFLPSCSSRVGDTALGCIELKMVLLTPYLVRRVRKSRKAVFCLKVSLLVFLWREHLDRTAKVQKESFYFCDVLKIVNAQSRGRQDSCIQWLPHALHQPGFLGKAGTCDHLAQSVFRNLCQAGQKLSSSDHF